MNLKVLSLTQINDHNGIPINIVNIEYDTGFLFF